MLDRGPGRYSIESICPILLKLEPSHSQTADAPFLGSRFNGGSGKIYALDLEAKAGKFSNKESFSTANI